MDNVFLQKKAQKVTLLDDDEDDDCILYVKKLKVKMNVAIVN